MDTGNQFLASNQTRDELPGTSGSLLEVGHFNSEASPNMQGDDLTKPQTMMTPGVESATRMAIKVIRAPPQRGDTDPEGAEGVELADGIASDMSMTHFGAQVASAAEPLQSNENRKRPRSETPKAPGDWGSRMELTVQQQAQILTQLHRTRTNFGNLVEAHEVYEEDQSLEVKVWMD